MAQSSIERPLPELLPIYARNVELLTFKKGWTAARLAHELGVTSSTLNRLRFCRNRYLDLDIFQDLLRIFDCSPNDLLLPQPDIDYTVATKPR